MTAAEILKTHNLNRTHCRVLVLEQLMNSPRALTQNELDEALRPLCNRSTLYRILNTLEENGLLKRIDLEDGNRYFFDQSMVEHPDDNIDFVFFHCVKCNDLLPLRQVKQQGISVPEGFVVQEQRFVIRGICNKCNRSNYTIKL